MAAVSIAHRGKKAASALCRGLTFEFRAHDLRRTAATRMAEAGVPRDHIAKVLNHVEGGPAATRVYDRYDYDSEKRDALCPVVSRGRLAALPAWRWGITPLPMATSGLLYLSVNDDELNDNRGTFEVEINVSTPPSSDGSHHRRGSE